MIMLPIKMLHEAFNAVAGAANSAVEMPAKVAEAVAAAASFEPLEWFTDLVLGWEAAVLTWLSHVSGYGLLAMAGLWLARKLWRSRGDTTWLCWQVNGDAQRIAGGLGASGRQVCYGGQNVILVNAWDSGNVARLLQANDVQYEVMR